MHRKERSIKKNKKETEEKKHLPGMHVIAAKPSKTDPSGSYTGVPMNRQETPVQDADDL